MKYISASTIVTDEIHFFGSEEGITVPGGAGMYALCGMKLFADDVKPVCGSGQDFGERYGEWFRRNQIPTDEIIPCTEHTPFNIIHYREDGSRTETPKYGANHYREIEVRPDYLENGFRLADGIYIFRNSEKSFWEPVLSMKRKSKTKVMWEIAADAAYPENLSAVKAISQSIDVFSINMEEARRLSGMDEAGTVNLLRSFHVPLVFLRRGAQGCIMITECRSEAVPSASGVVVADPTGGGNSSSGAVLTGFCMGKSPVECAWMGNMAAAMCISRYGVPETISQEMRDQAWERVRKETQ